MLLDGCKYVPHGAGGGDSLEFLSKLLVTLDEEIKVINIILS